MRRPDPWQTDPKLRAALRAVIAKRWEDEFAAEEEAAVARFERERLRGDSGER